MLKKKKKKSVSIIVDLAYVKSTTSKTWYPES